METRRNEIRGEKRGELDSTEEEGEKADRKIRCRKMLDKN
jgi:hypothetical protein